MKLQDIIAFAKAGYKPSDVKELLSMEGAGENDNSNRDIQQDNTVVQSGDTDTETTEGSSDTDIDKENNKENNNEELDKYKDEIEKLKNQVKLLQEANKNKDVSNNNGKTLDEVIIDIFNNL